MKKMHFVKKIYPISIKNPKKYYSESIKTKKQHI